MSERSHWDPRVDAKEGLPYPVIYLCNVRAEPVGHGVIRLLIVDHWHHASAWDVLEEHGIGQEVVLVMDSVDYYYCALVGEDDRIYLHPMDGCNDSLPEDRRFLRKAFNLKLPW